MTHDTTRFSGKALRAALSTTFIVPLTLSMATGAMAQEQDEADLLLIEEVIVTGTRIPRDPNVAAPSPVQSISGEDIMLSGELDITEMLNDIPALLTSTSATNSAAGIFGSGSGETQGSEDGESLLSLRGLGVERTLVLVDGRRHVAGIAGTQAVDIGTIPSALIERVEVMTGGASAIYGADAVTGVVNFVMKKDFEGIKLNLQTGISGDGDGEQYRFSGTYGKNFSDDRGNFTISVDYSKSNAIFAGDREFSRNNGVASDDSNPALRFQQGDISAGGTPNFALFYSPSTNFASSDSPCDLFGYNYCYGFHNTGFPILSAEAFTNLWRQAFPGDPDPVFTSAELALIEQAATAPTRFIGKGHNFSLSSPGGVILPGGIFTTGIDLDGNGIDDCEQSFQGFISTFAHSPPGFGFIGGCWIIEDNGNVRPLVDGLIAGDINQFGADGIADGFDKDFLMPEIEKYSTQMTGRYELSDNINAFAEFKYVRQNSSNGGPLNTFWDLLTVAPDNPYIAQLPGPLAALGMSEGLFITRDPADLGPNIDTSKRETYRFVGGFDGELDNGWTYEISANYGKFNQTFRDNNRVIVDRWFAAIDAVADPVTGEPICRSDIDPTPPPTTPFQIPAFESGFFTFNPGDGSCKPANILGGRGAISQEAIDFVTTTVINKFALEQVVVAASMAGTTEDFLELPAGPIGFAIGAEYRDEKSASMFDDLTRGILPVTTADGSAGSLVADLGLSQESLVFDSGSFIQNAGGSYDVKEIYGEISVPIFRDKTFFEDVTIDAAARYSDYSTVGGTFTWKVGGSWSPIADIRFRATYSIAVRAPNVTELFSPTQSAFFRPVDPCVQTEIDALIAVGDPRGPIRAANCAAAGIPGGFVDPLTARFVGSTSGNPDLFEEEASTLTVGAVIQPSFLRGLTLTVDYWDIEITDAIQAVSAQDIVDNCYDSAEFPNQFCSQFTRNSNPGSPQFNGFTSLNQTQLNFAALKTSGIDFAARYRFDIDEFDVTLSISGSKVFEIDNFFDPADPTAVDPELGELQRPEWAGNFNARVARGPIALTWQTQYMSKQGLRGVEIETAEVVYGPAGIAGETWVHDFGFSYEIDERFQVYGGVNNVTDEIPYLTEFAYPVSPMGRFFFLGVNVSM